MAIDFTSLPLREIRKGRELRWDPHSVDLTKDAKDWATLDPDEQTIITAQVFGFLLGERAVTHDLAPLQQVLRKERGHMEEEMYLTQQLFEETTHVEFFQRWLDEALPGTLGVEIPMPPGEPSPILKTILPETLTALDGDPSPAAQMRATIIYHQIVEGVIAELGYQIFYDCLDPRDIMPGLREGVRNIQIDESRHIAFGTYLAQRLIRDHPELEDLFTEAMKEMLPEVEHSADLLFNHFDDPLPFDIDRDGVRRYATELHERRVGAVLAGGLVDG